MVQTILAKDISLYELEEQFGLQLIDDPALQNGQVIQQLTLVFLP